MPKWSPLTGGGNLVSMRKVREILRLRFGPTVNFHGEMRSNQTRILNWQEGTRKKAKLSYNGNLLVKNRHGHIVNTEVFEANGTAERHAELVTLEQIGVRAG
jgi:hypothetical protein